LFFSKLIDDNDDDEKKSAVAGRLATPLTFEYNLTNFHLLITNIQLFFAYLITL